MSVTFRGFPACDCLAQWLPLFEAELQRRGILDGPLTIFQLIGNAPASAGVHSKGGAFDIAPLGKAGLEVARQMGADPTWDRTFKPYHAHGVLRGCPHNGPARYQVEAVDNGFNGLGEDGEAGLDDGPRPLSGRTWKQGIKWAREQEENDVDEATIDKIADEAAERVLASKISTNHGDLSVEQILRELLHEKRS